MIAKVLQNNFKSVKKKIDKLIKLEGKDAFEVVGEMKAIVPEYLSENSEFEKLDEKNIEGKGII